MATCEETKRMIEVMQAYVDGKNVEFFSKLDDTWKKLESAPLWNFAMDKYRIADPYAELKAAAKDPTKQIRIKGGKWQDFGHPWTWYCSSKDYEIRDKPERRKVRLLAWYNLATEQLVWLAKDATPSLGCKRIPSEDREFEVEID